MGARAILSRLALSLLLLLYHFLAQLFAFVLKVPFATESDVILGVLGLIDLAFTGNLVVIVIFSGYENFVSRIEAGEHDRPYWMAKVDFGGLKQKLATSIVAISAIQVLKAFMNIEHYDNTKLALAGRHPCPVPGIAADRRALRPAFSAEQTSERRVGAKSGGSS